MSNTTCFLHVDRPVSGTELSGYLTFCTSIWAILRQLRLDASGCCVNIDSGNLCRIRIVSSRSRLKLSEIN